MHTHWKTRGLSIVVAIAGVGSLCLSQPTFASCAAIDAPPTTYDIGRPLLTAFGRQGSESARFLRVSDAPIGASIVGVWKFEMTSKNTASNTNPMPDGTLLDFGTQAWHSDGTELMNSGSRNPADGNFCQGVWRKVGPSRYSLNHLALAWISGTYLGPVAIHMLVDVANDARSFTGTFTQSVYAASPTPGQEFDMSTQVVKLSGVISATRLSED